MLNASCTSVAVLGVPFHNLTMDEAVAIIEEHIREGGFHQIATANVDFLKNALHNRRLRDILCSCEMVVPDGMPVVWMSRLIGTPLKERVSGIDLVERLADVSARRGYGVFLLGASEHSSHRAAKVLTQRYPGLRIAGRYCPEPRALDLMNHEEILRRIEEARPDILLVAFGNPKQEEWLAMHRDRLKVPVCIGIGGTLDSLSGTLGFVAYELEVPVSEVVQKGPGLAFVVYAEAIARLPLAPIWAVLFFLMLIIVGSDTEVNCCCL